MKPAPRRMVAGVLLAAVVGLSCATTKTVISPLVRSAVNAGDLMVGGQSPEAAGPRIYAEMLETPEFAELVAPFGEPVRLRVERPGPAHLPGRGSATRITAPRKSLSGDPNIRIYVFFDGGLVVARPGNRGSWVAEPTGLATPEGLEAWRAAEARRDAEAARDRNAAEQSRRQREAAAQKRRERERREQAARESAPPPVPPTPEAAEPSAVEPEATAEPASVVRQPSPEQIDDCPIEPWREDCRELCAPGASWEWCGYRE